MALFRTPPTCLICGKPTAEAIYEDQSHIPEISRVVGDSFIGWKPIDHVCNSESQKLDIETVIKFVNEMNKKYPYPLEFISHNILPDQTILKCGNKVYYSPNIKAGKVKVVDVPENDLEMKAPDFTIKY